MRVLQINSVCGIGSTGRIATDIHQLLIEQGYESYIAYGRSDAKNCNNTIRIGSEFDNYMHVAKTRILDLHGFGSKNATIKFVEKIKEINPDIIHLHNIHGYYINIEVLFKYLKEANKPVIWTLHDCWSFTGHCSYFDYVGCNRWENGCEVCPQLNEYPKGLFIDNSKWNYQMKKNLFTGLENLTIVTPSKWLCDLVKKSFLQEYEVKVINNGINIELFNPSIGQFRQKYELENKFIILGVANVWDRRKGLNYFVDLADKICDDEKIVLVGLSDKQIDCLPKNILGISRTSDINELVGIYSAADVFFNPTLEDNFPTVNLESQACGTPVITFNTGGSSETIVNNGGLIVDKGNMANVIDCINYFKHLDYSDRLFYLEDWFDKKRAFELYIDLYLDNV